MTNPNAFESDDWRGPTAPVRIAKRASFGRAPQLHQAAKPGNHAVEFERAREVINVAKETMQHTFAEVRLGRSFNASSLTPIVDGIVASITRNPRAIPSILRLKSTDEYSYLHSVAVCGLTIALGREMGLGQSDLRDIGLGGLLHDIGKSTISNDLLNKPAPLTADEESIMRSHTKRGEKMLIESGGVPPQVIEMCALHHERLDGSGYPYGLEADSISVPARMVAICDVYDGLTSGRVDKESLTAIEAIELLRAEATKFDGQIVKIFSRMLGSLLPGTLVRLMSNRLAVVLNDLVVDPLNPSVAVFYCVDQHRMLPLRRVRTEVDQISSIERAEQWNFGTDWTDLRHSIIANLADTA